MNNLREVIITNYSGTITAGGTAQNAIAANPIRQFLAIQNPPAATENLYVAFGVAAVSTNADLTLEPGAMMIFDVQVPTAYVSVLGSTTAHPFIVKEG